MKGIGYFQNLRNFLRFFLDFFLEIFWEDDKFFGEIFLENFFGRMFWEEFFWRNYLVQTNKKLMFLSRQTQFSYNK